jgi:hypothetical protein
MGHASRLSIPFMPAGVTVARSEAVASRWRTHPAGAEGDRRQIGLALSGPMIQPLHYRHTASFLNSDFGTHAVFHRACPFCGTRLAKRYREYGYARDYRWEDFVWESWACLACGWWWDGSIPERSFSRGMTTAAVLARASGVPQQLVTALSEVRKDAKALLEMPPAKFEHFVGGMLREFYNCDVVFCGRSHDGGIDLILIDSDSGHIPIQVKRRSKPEHVEAVSLVREFRGAMLLRGYDRGRIVTTADHFSREAVRAARPEPEHLVSQEIDLVDCRRLFDIMALLCSPTGSDHLWHLCGPGPFDSVSPRPGLEAMQAMQKGLRNFAQRVRRHVDLRRR